MAVIMEASILQMYDMLFGLTVVLWLCNWIFLLPSADVRLEEFVYEKLEKKAPTRMNNHELLGQSMMDSGTEFGPGTAYGQWYTKLLFWLLNTILLWLQIQEFLQCRKHGRNWGIWL